NNCLSIKAMCAGTIVRSATGISSCVVFTAEQLGDLLGVDKAHNANSVLLVANGDGAAQSAHVEGCTYQNGNWYAVFNVKASGPFRFNYLGIRFQ
ncbi:hypothetical protein, partial [Mordavella massiliensis]|uniref:hypothetical protein n=1 Tax=Mordavella massiliensis TaxID=1871024 RepID=UPI0019563427